MAAKGMVSPEAGDAYIRAHALCQQVGEMPQRFRALSGLFRFHNTQARLHTSGELSQQLFNLAQRQDDPVLMREAHALVGVFALYRGDLVVARAHLEQSFERPDADQPSTHILAGGIHSRIESYAWTLRLLWVLGYADQAQQRSQEVLALAQQLGHTPSLALLEYFAAILCQSRRDVAETYVHADALMALAIDQGFVLRLEQGRILRGWALAMQGDVAEGVAQLRQGLAAHQDIGPKVGQPYRLSLLAEALTLVAATEERWWEAELHRLKGALLLQLALPEVSQAEACCQQALDVARRQQAKALELRAALSLSRLWQQQGQRAAARDLLVPIYGWFTEGFDTADL
jgi:predicted ATPase